MMGSEFWNKMFSWIEKKVFEKSLKNPRFFANVVRPLLYKIARGDPEQVHEMALNALNTYKDVVKKVSHAFYFPDLEINLKGHIVMPFGTAAGLDKNGDALIPLSYLFGFQETGTVVVSPREGNARPRLAVDPVRADL